MLSNNNRTVKKDIVMTKVGDPNAFKDQIFADNGKSLCVPATDGDYRGVSDLRYSNGDIE